MAHEFPPDGFEHERSANYPQITMQQAYAMLASNTARRVDHDHLPVQNLLNLYSVNAGTKNSELICFKNEEGKTLYYAYNRRSTCEFKIVGVEYDNGHSWRFNTRGDLLALHDQRWPQRSICKIPGIKGFKVVNALTRFDHPDGIRDLELDCSNLKVKFNVIALVRTKVLTKLGRWYNENYMSKSMPCCEYKITLMTPSPNEGGGWLTETVYDKGVTVTYPGGDGVDPDLLGFDEWSIRSYNSKNFEMTVEGLDLMTRDFTGIRFTDKRDPSNIKQFYFSYTVDPWEEFQVEMLAHNS